MNLRSLLGTQRSVKDKTGLGLNEYSVVPPPPAQVNSPAKNDLSSTGLPEFVDDTDTDYSRPTPSIDVSKDVSDEQKAIWKSNSASFSEQGGSVGNVVSKPMIRFVKETGCPSVSKVNNTEKSRKPTVKYAEMYRSQRPRGNQRNWNNQKSQQLGSDFVMIKKACYVCGSFEHLQYTCKHKRHVNDQKQVKPVWNNSKRVNHHYSTRITHPNPKRNMIPQAILMRSGRKTINAAKPKAVHNAVKASACWVWKPKNRVIDHVSKYNNASITLKRFDYIDAQGRFKWMHRLRGGMSMIKNLMQKLLLLVQKLMILLLKLKCTSEGVQQRQKIKKKGRGFPEQKTVEGLKTAGYRVTTAGSRLMLLLKLISVLFIDSECLALGKDFKLVDDTHVLLRTPRQQNMYSIDLKNIVPHKNLTCLIDKASKDESMLLHRRLGHLNFKTMNKLVRNNLVKGLPSKSFENNHTCVACLKGKQHKASCKTKLVNSVTKPLHTLHMDLFGPTSVSSLNHKWSCLFLTDDFMWCVTWTFFLKSKDETSSILRNFITEIENLKDLKVKIIRCDNGGEFRNKEMDEFCSRKAARTMLADAKLPVTFWAEAVNTACYVQNRVLVNKSQHKTPYELFNGRSPAIGFLRPFGCHVMILNTLDHLGKFDAKGDEGYFVGYSLNSKAFRVFNKRTKKIDENLHVDFLENQPIEKGTGPNWLFDIDSLTKSMNYVPVVVAGTSSTNISGTKEDALKENVSSLRYIALPNWFHEALKWLL
ncbi:putative ribonuclease H-like domain-containing protein [Tanacetum coccineum]